MFTHTMFLPSPSDLFAQQRHSSVTQTSRSISVSPRRSATPCSHRESRVSRIALPASPRGHRRSSRSDRGLSSQRINVSLPRLFVVRQEPREEREDGDGDDDDDDSDRFCDSAAVDDKPVVGGRRLVQRTAHRHQARRRLVRERDGRSAAGRAVPRASQGQRRQQLRRNSGNESIKKMSGDGATRSTLQRCNVCYAQTEDGIQPLEAMLYTIERVNQDPRILAGVRLGALAFDTCDNPTYALQQAFYFVKGNRRSIKDDQLATSPSQRHLASRRFSVLASQVSWRVVTDSTRRATAARIGAWQSSWTGNWIGWWRCSGLSRARSPFRFVHVWFDETNSPEFQQFNRDLRSRTCEEIECSSTCISQRLQGVGKVSLQFLKNLLQRQMKRRVSGSYCKMRHR